MKNTAEKLRFYVSHNVEGEPFGQVLATAQNDADPINAVLNLQPILLNQFVACQLGSKISLHQIIINICKRRLIVIFLLTDDYDSQPEGTNAVTDLYFCGFAHRIKFCCDVYLTKYLK